MNFNKIAQFVFDKIFSGVTFAIAIGGLFFYLIMSIAQSEEAERQQTKALTAACYAGGMVLVDTDAGKRCVAPANLVVIK